MKDATLIIYNANEVCTLDNGDQGLRTGAAMDNLNVIEKGAIALVEDVIVGVGTTEEILDSFRAETQIDGTGTVLMPGFVDPHTHVVFAGSREHEFEMRLRGESYMEIAAAGGGIRSSMRATRAASVTQLIEESIPRLNRMLAWGTTTIEAKSGYGLELETELRQLEAIRELHKQHEIDLVPTFLGAHEIPDEYRDHVDEYVRIVIEEMIPAVVERGLAAYCDVFCEAGVFNIDQSRAILQAAKAAGLKVRLHADEFVDLGGAMLAAELQAISADHLLAISDEGIQAMQEAGVIATLLPGTTFSLGKKEYAPARKMIDAGLPIALATDCNPGSCYTESMQIIIALACTQMRMTPAEAITASTLNAAHALELGDHIGSLSVGKQADIVVFDMPSYRTLPYHFGVNHVRFVIKRGEVITV